ncbi:MAG: DUF3575 domain-containing protein [bacterium]
MNKNSSSTDLLIKKCFLILFCSIISINAFTQKSIKTDIFIPTMYCVDRVPFVFELSFETKIKPHLTLQTGFNYGTFIIESKDSKVKGLAPYLETRYYFKKDETVLPKGIFIGVYCKFVLANYDKIDWSTGTYHKEFGLIYGIGPDIGFKFKIKSFSIEPLIGGAFGGSTLTPNDGLPSVTQLKFALQRYELSIGYEF